ncbi:serine protease [Gigaspora margarita]|uniref:Serine protease n=1 Tax=Gigaspora margarita TaxID=4874 RepID=A0A8H4A7U4_GIGMA|nr:serine protease [Gigaspora margarita]
MKYIYLYITLLFFTFQKYLITHAREPLAEFWDIEDDEILSFLETEKYLSLVDRTLKSLLDDISFGETFVDLKNNKINVHTVNESRIPDIISQPELRNYSNSINFIPANKSSDNLKFSFNEIIRIANKTKSSGLSGIVIIIHPLLNEVTVNLPIGNINITETIQDFINAIMIYDPKIIHPIDSSASNTKRGIGERGIFTKVSSGDKIYFDNNATCSAGFWAKRKNKQFLVSAGHCIGNFNDTTSKPKVFYHGLNDKPLLVGKVVYSIWSAPYDFSLIDIKRMDIRLKPSKNMRNRFYTSPELIIEKNGIPQSSHITHLCKSGSRTYITCGNIISFNGSFISEQGDLYTGIIISSTEAAPGDSGSPSFSYLNLRSVTLNGIISWTRNSNIENRFTATMPLQLIFNKAGITL